MREAFIGSEALANGELTRAQLRWNYRRIFPDIYVPAFGTPSLRVRTTGAWLWSRRHGVIAGRAAAALLGARWVDDRVPVEMIWRSGRPPQGIIVRNERIDGDEVTQVAGLFVTTPERTALDLARHLPYYEAVICLDALARATGVTALDVMTLAQRYPGARGTRVAVEALSLMDGGAETPHETLLRLTLRKQWVDRPATQIRLADGDTEMFLDVGYEVPMVGLDCEGRRFDEVYTVGHGRCDRDPEIDERERFAESQGWQYIYVLWEDCLGSIWARVGRAFKRRGFRPKLAPRPF